jgi:hypothetical protein
MSFDEEFAFSNLKNSHYFHYRLRQSIPRPVEQKIQDYFQQCLLAGNKLNFHGDLSLNDGVSLFLYWLCTYSSEREIGL